MKIIVSNTIEITDPSAEIINYCKLNLVVNNPEYIKKKRMGFWLGNTSEKLTLYKRIGNTWYLPYGCIKSVLRMVDIDDVMTVFADVPDVDYKANIPLYDYQEEAVQEMYDAKLGILQAPAGSGKTQMGIALICKYGKRALWITHTKDLLNQSYNRAKTFMPENMLGKITEGKIEIGTGITFATIQTLCNCDLHELENMWDVIIVDECHRISGSPTVVTQFYQVLNNLRARHKYGLSATVHRSDGMINCTYALIGRIAHSISDEQVGDKIVSVGIKMMTTEVSISEECQNVDGTINYSGLINYLCDNVYRNSIILNAIEENKLYSSLILSDRIEHLETLMSRLPDDMKKDAVMITGKMTSKKGKAEREQAILDMQSGKKKYLFATYSLAKEGLDIPRLERLYMATPVKDYAVVVQSVGRIARKFEGKTDPICYDFVDNIRYLQKCYKKRWTSYKKANCYEVSE